MLKTCFSCFSLAIINNMEGDYSGSVSYKKSHFPSIRCSWLQGRKRWKWPIPQLHGPKHHMSIHIRGSQRCCCLKVGPLVLRQAGTWDPWLQCLHLEEHLLKQQNTKKLQGTKITVCVNIWDKLADNKIWKDPKRPTATSEDLGAKQGLHTHLGTKYHHRGGQTTPKHPLPIQPWHTSTSPHKELSHACLG